MDYPQRETSAENINFRTAEANIDDPSEGQCILEDNQSIDANALHRVVLACAGWC